MKMTEHGIERPLVSFVLLAYNQERYIREAVEGAFSQDYSPLQIVISDDCSSDRTFEIIEGMAASYRGRHEVVIRQNTQNVGLALNYNFAVDESRGRFIVVGAGDDIAYPSKTMRLVAPMITDDTVMGTHSSVHTISLDGSRLGERRRTDGIVEDPRRVVEERYMVVAQSHAFRKKIFDVFGPFGAYLTDEGAPMAFRETALGRIVYVDECLMAYRLGGGVSSTVSQGTDGRTVADPLKYATWRYSAYRQIAADFEIVRNEYPELAQLIRQHLIFHEGCYLANRDPWSWKGLWQAVSTGPAGPPIKAFIRRNAPRPVRHLYTRFRAAFS